MIVVGDFIILNEVKTVFHLLKDRTFIKNKAYLVLDKYDIEYVSGIEGIDYDDYNENNKSEDIEYFYILEDEERSLRAFVLSEIKKTNKRTILIEKY